MPVGLSGLHPPAGCLGSQALPASGAENPECTQVTGSGLRSKAGSKVWVPGAALHSHPPPPAQEDMAACLVLGKAPLQPQGPEGGSKNSGSWRVAGTPPHIWVSIKPVNNWPGTCAPQGLSTVATVHFLGRPHPAGPGARLSVGSLCHPWPAKLRPSGLLGHLSWPCQPPIQGCYAQEETCPALPTHNEPHCRGQHPSSTTYSHLTSLCLSFLVCKTN